MANTIITKDKLQAETTRKFDNKNEIFNWANTKYTGTLKQSGDTVTVQTIPNTTYSHNVTAGADMTATDFAITDSDLTIDKAAQFMRNIKNIEQIQSNLDLQSKLTERMSDEEANVMDRYTASFVHSALAANQENAAGTPVALTKTNVEAQIELMRVNLAEQNAFNEAALFVDPSVHSLLRQSSNYTGFSDGMMVRKNGVVGEYAGFKLIETNNLPYVNRLSMATEPTADDTVVIQGVTFTFKAVPSAAGEVDLGGSAAVSQANLVAAINGGSGAGTAYIALDAADRETLLNYGITAGDFAADVSIVTANRTFTTAETFTDGTDSWGTLAKKIFAMDKDAIHVVRQESVMDIRQSVTGFNYNLMSEFVYGGALLGDNANAITTNEIAA